MEDKLLNLMGFKAVPRPPSGWIKAIRESLGMTARQLGLHLGMSAPAATKLEARERNRSITLRDLDRAAHVLGCQVVYALIPYDSLEQTLNEQAHRTAERLATKAHHHMSLEAQAVPATETRAQINVLAAKLKETLDPRLWEPEDKK
jgi:predicted DNA-binding mobile mystery protein A